MNKNNIPIVNNNVSDFMSGQLNSHGEFVESMSSVEISELEKNAFVDFIGSLKSSEHCSWHKSYTEHGHNW